MAFYSPPPQVPLEDDQPPLNVDEHIYFSESDHDQDDDIPQDDENGDQQDQNGEEWFEEQLEADLKWSFALNRVLHKGTSQFQDAALLDSKRFGKVLVIDGRLQSAEKDEFIYHESLVHPALLLHENPKTIFIMGGGEGSTAREALKHKGVEKVIMCDIDEVVVNFCRVHLEANHEAFSDNRLQLVFNDAKAELEKTEERFDVIVGDVTDPIEGGPCNDLYTKRFYEQVIKPHLKDNGIFVTQAGPAGMLSHKDIFTSIYNTVKHVFKYVFAYTAHVPSYADSCGWVVASNQPLKLDAAQLDSRIQERIQGELLYLDGAFIVSSTVVNKTIFASLMEETNVFTEETTKFCYGHGLTDDAQLHKA
ncbi:PREDICTED: thermospermine synthase ACAULIS5-like [Fragaria vesca subsp. vesca]|uniref:thermospermine synthase ACAULIS5-like n=1 Tax=Fragaria vesca subsp. vesca TaxID=101020 RepID=UPI0002C3708C|nr:PREDICTED: thermospermine synthase ACAULIS5-like [Fragaria vesca subsp. vesca]